VPLAYGIHKLQISCVVEDEKVSVDWLQENIESMEDYVSTVRSTALGM
jgi:elongation factor 1-delta